MKLTTAILALSLSFATAAQANGLAIEVGSGKDNVANTDYYSVKMKDKFALPGAFSLTPEVTINSNDNGGATWGKAKLGVGHDVLAYGPLTVNATANLVEHFGTASRYTAWSIEPGASLQAGALTLTASYEYEQALKDSVKGDVQTTKVGVAMPISKKTTAGLRYEMARGDKDRNVLYAGISMKF